MSVLAHIGRRSEKQLITAIVAPGLGRPLIQAFREAPGVLTVSHHHARGSGARKNGQGQRFFKECDVVLILVESEQADEVFKAVFEASKVGQRGGGLMFSETVMRGHPLIPFETTLSTMS
jgi:nitrogen regulatory protein PII